MPEKYIRQNKNSCLIVKNSKTYAKVSSLDDAIFIREMLIGNDWDLSKTPQTVKKEDNYLVLTVYDDKIYILAKYKTLPDSKTIEKLVKKHERNPNNSKYGLNITKIFETYVITKQIAGDEYIFGYYDILEDAEFVRNFLLDHMWDVSQFETVNYCEDSDDYKVVRVIDDKVYVLDSFFSKNIDLNKVYGDFLSKISKHKYGLENHPHLDELTDKIPELERELNVKATDNTWDFSNVSDDPLNEMIFNLTPFQKSVYDVVDDSGLEDIKKALIRYRSKNFDEKIQKHLIELVNMGLIEKQGEIYIKK